MELLSELSFVWCIFGRLDSFMLKSQQKLSPSKKSNLPPTPWGHLHERGKSSYLSYVK